MKKFLKVFIICFLVIAVILVTGIVFFKRNKEKNNTTSSFADMLASDSKVEFDNYLQMVDDELGTPRILFILETSKKLDEIVYALSTYEIENNTKINDEKIAKSFNKVNDSRRLLTLMMKEFEIKIASPFYNKNLGVNDIYTQACKYLTEYANLVKLLNNRITYLNKDADIKFYIIDIYTNIANQTFTKITTDSNNYVGVESSNNIERINSIVEFDGSELLTVENKFSINVTNFVNYYKICNKIEFARDFTLNLAKTINTNNATNEEMSTHYLKLIYGI